jgi:hypothetical protein
MSSTNVSAILSELQAARADILALKSQVSSLEAVLSSKTMTVGAAPSSTAKPVKEKKPRKKSDAPPTPWRLFTDRVRSVLSDAEFKGKALGVECVQFCATLKEENADFDSWTTEAILARRADWSAPEVSRGEAKFGPGWAKTGERRAAAKAASAGNSVVSGDADGEDVAASGGGGAASTDKPKKERKNPWAGLTEEQRAAKVAAMKAGKAAKKAADSGAAPADEADGSAPSVHDAAPVTPKPSAAASSSAVTVAKAENAAPSASSSEFKGVMVGGKRYLVNLESGHCYNRMADGSQGDWAGIFHRTGGPKGGPYVDDSVPEPNAADDDELVFDE